MKKSTFLHNLLHVVLPFLLIYIVVRGEGEINFMHIIAIFAGALTPDIDHFAMYKKDYKSFLNFLKFCLTTDRFRRGFLIFHNDLALLFVTVSMLTLKLVNFYLTLFFFAFFAHLVYDYLSDLLLIKTYKHWRFKNLI